MKLSNIAFNNLRRRKAKAAFLIAGLMIGVASIVLMITVMQAMEEDARKVEQMEAKMADLERQLAMKVPQYGEICHI